MYPLRSPVRGWVAVAGVLTACILNPQPEPPGNNANSGAGGIPSGGALGMGGRAAGNGGLAHIDAIGGAGLDAGEVTDAGQPDVDDSSQ